MDTEEKFYSCFLEKNVADQAIETKIKFLPAKLAYVGAVVDGFVVTNVFNKVTANSNNKNEFVTSWQMP